MIYFLQAKGRADAPVKIGFTETERGLWNRLDAAPGDTCLSVTCRLRRALERRS